MQDLNLPSYPFSIKREKNNLLIFDEFRNKWIILTPEEWVRQHVLMFLVIQKGYPKSLIAVEKSVNVNGLSQRFDAVLFNHNTKPIVLIECKAFSVKITENTFNQALRYNAVIGAPFLILTNGLTTYCGKIDLENQHFFYLEEVPNYIDLKELRVE